MPSPVAVLVEDLPEQARVSEEVLVSAGFRVSQFSDFTSAQDYVHDTDDLVDLFVLDRRLPVSLGDPAADEVGDQLLQEVRASHPDARVIVFTGYTGVPHIQQAVQGGGQLPCNVGTPIDRVTVLDKGQTLEFKRQLRELRTLIQSLEDIELTVGSPTVAASAQDRRCLRRLGFEYAAVSVSAQPMPGGLTGANVWLCELRQTGGIVARVVTKRVAKPAAPGGLSALLNPASAAGSVRSVSGLMGGKHLNVLQLAGVQPKPLIELLGPKPVDALEVVKPLWDELSKIPAQSSHMSIADLCAPLISWDELSELLEPFGVVVPVGSLVATAKIGMRHGDFHPANVLVNEHGAVLIDFDSSELASAALDPVTMLLSTLVHPASPILGADWVPVAEIRQTFGTATFGNGHSHEAWFAGVWSWISSLDLSEREFWSMVLAYAGRQLRFKDVRDDEETLSRVVALAAVAAERLHDS